VPPPRTRDCFGNHGSGLPRTVLVLVRGAPDRKNMFYVYVLKSIKKNDQLYVGYTVDLQERIKKHNHGLVQSTKPYFPWDIIFYEAYKNQFDAKNRELYLKTTKGRRALRLMLKNVLNSKDN